MDIRRRMADALLEREVARRLEKAMQGFLREFEDTPLREPTDEEADERRPQLEEALPARNPQHSRVDFEGKTLPRLLEQAEKEIREAVRKEREAS
jgi:hypothetical protein